jgi:hypothetical protein
VTPGIVFEDLQAYQRTAALKAAIELDIFRAIGQGRNGIPSLARHANASQRGIRILCDFLVIHGLLQKSDGRYQHTPSSAAFLDPASPSCLASIVGFLAQPALQQPFENLADIVCKGRTQLPGEGTVEPDNPVWVNFAQSMAPMMAPMAAPLGRIALEGRTGKMNVLDIAAGHGLFGIEIAVQNPHAHVTGLDWAPVLRAALDNAKKAGVQDRYDMLPGSAFKVGRRPLRHHSAHQFLAHFDVANCISLLKRPALSNLAARRPLEFVPNEVASLRLQPPRSA